MIWLPLLNIAFVYYEGYALQPTYGLPVRSLVGRLSWQPEMYHVGAHRSQCVLTLTLPIVFWASTTYEIDGHHR